MGEVKAERGTTLDGIAASAASLRDACRITLRERFAEAATVAAMALRHVAALTVAITEHNEPLIQAGREPIGSLVDDLRPDVKLPRVVAGADGPDYWPNKPLTPEEVELVLRDLGLSDEVDMLRHLIALLPSRGASSS